MLAVGRCCCRHKYDPLSSSHLNTNHLLYSLTVSFPFLLFPHFSFYQCLVLLIVFFFPSSLSRCLFAGVETCAVTYSWEMVVSFMYSTVSLLYILYSGCACWPQVNFMWYTVLKNLSFCFFCLYKATKPYCLKGYQIIMATAVRSHPE